MKKMTKMMKKTHEVDQGLERANVEKIEQERIDFEHKARMLRTNLYNAVQQRDMPRGWVDAQHK
ncbi:MAG: hypothetical protein ACXWLM_04575 [Myxococcales bacterium]